MSKKISNFGPHVQGIKISRDHSKATSVECRIFISRSFFLTFSKLKHESKWSDTIPTTNLLQNFRKKKFYKNKCLKVYACLME